MSQPEWMTKFKQIGQKSQEEVTTIDEDGIVTEHKALIDQEFKFGKPITSPTPAPKSPDDDDADADADAAALSAPATLKTEKEEDATAGSKPAEQNADKDEESAAALLSASVGENSAVVNDDGAGPRKEEVVEEEETIEEEIIEEEIEEEYIVEESVVSGSVVEESIVSSSIEHESTQGEGEEPTEHTRNIPLSGEEAKEEGYLADAAAANDEQKMTDEEFGEPWVVDRDRVLNELSTTQFDEVEVERDTGNVHYEEVYLDENGNEVIGQQGDSDTLEEEVLVDEYGDEIVDDEDYTEEEIPRSTASMANDEAFVVSSQKLDDKQGEEEDDEPFEAPYDPDYDVENQIKLLQRGSKAYRSRMAGWVPYAFFFGFIAASILVLFFVLLAEDDGIDSQSVPTAAPTPRSFLPLNPTNTGDIDVAATTSMTPVQGGCNFGRELQPHVIDQCSCTGKITIIADDIRSRWNSLRESFIPTVDPDFNEDIDSCAATNQALVWLSSGVNNGGEAQAFVRRERYALASFYIEQGGTGWTNNGLWLSQLNVCLWDRVSCDRGEKVNTLDISRNGLIGQLSGAVSMLENLENFSVAQNNLEGTIPATIFDCVRLRTIDLSNNAFFGVIPPFPKTSILEVIEFQSNNLSGRIQSNIANVMSLSTLNLANNALNGALPTEMFDLPLMELYLGPNFFSGSIPDAIGNASSLTALALGPNKFTGDIPTPIGDLTNLTRLIIEDVPELTGRLPASYGLGLINLKEFIMKGTDVRGNIPDQFGLMTSLQVLDLSRNSLGRQLPTALGALTSLKSLKLQDNAFTGTIPSELGNAASLTELNMHVNQLVGTIPSSVGRMLFLATLTLDGNFLDGRAPEEICDLRQERLNEFTVDCPERVNEVLVIGVICSIPSCCTVCF